MGQLMLYVTECLYVLIILDYPINYLSDNLIEILNNLHPSDFRNTIFTSEFVSLLSISARFLKTHPILSFWTNLERIVIRSIFTCQPLLLWAQRGPPTSALVRSGPNQGGRLEPKSSRPAHCRPNPVFSFQPSRQATPFPAKSSLETPDGYHNQSQN